MSQQSTDVFIYRIHDKGLEVFILDHQSEPVPAVNHDLTQSLTDGSDHIALEPVVDAQGYTRNAIAIEADWHDIPSLRQLILTDYIVAKEKAKAHIKSMLPEMPSLDLEKGTYVAAKDAFKQLLPEQYAFLKELKNILREKNQALYI